MTDKKVKLNAKDKNCFKSLCAKLEPDSTINDSTINSDSTNFFSDSVTSSNGHLKYCHFKSSGQCICPNLIKYAKAREKRKKRELERMRRNGFNSSSSDEDDKTYNKTYRFKSESHNSLRSLESSDPSFYTADVGPSKPPSPTSFNTFKEPFNSDLSTGKNDQISDLNHNESNDQSMIQQMENGLVSYLPNSNSIIEEKIKPFFKRLSIVAQEQSNDNEFKECLTEAYQVSQQDPKEFVSKLTTILEESTLSQENYSVQYFHHFFTKFKHVEIQNESLPKSFIDKTMSPASQTTPKKILYPFGSNTPKTPKNTSKSQSSPLFVSTVSRLIEATNQILKHPNVSALKSPSPLSNSMSKHNDSSFTYLEKKYVGEHPVSQNTAPELTDQEKEVLELCKKQLKALEDSPQIQKEAFLLQKKKYCELSSKMDSPCFTSTKTYEDTPNIDVNGQDVNVNDSILNEYVTQRRRCLETEKTIREIQAASVKDSGIDCNLLNILTEYSDNQQFVTTNNKSQSTKKSTPLSSSKNKEEKVLLKINFESVSPQNIHKTSKKPSTNTQSSKKKTVFKTVLSKSNLKSPGYTVSTRSPTANAKKLNFISPHLRPSHKSRRSGSRSPSPLPSTRNKSKSPTPVTPKTSPPSVPKFIITCSTPKLDLSPISKSTNKNKNKNIAAESPNSAFFSGGKYFTNPGKTPVQKKKSKKTFFQVPTPLKEKILNIDNIRSPVRDYINGKGMVVIKHVHRHDNPEEMKITPITKKKLEVKKKLQKGESIQNDENKVGQKNPKVIEDVVVDYAIRLTTVAQKKVFHLQSKD